MFYRNHTVYSSQGKTTQSRGWVFPGVSPPATLSPLCMPSHRSFGVCSLAWRGITSCWLWYNFLFSCNSKTTHLGYSPHTPTEAQLNDGTSRRATPRRDSGGNDLCGISLSISIYRIFFRYRFSQRHSVLVLARFSLWTIKMQSVVVWKWNLTTIRWTD